MADFIVSGAVTFSALIASGISYRMRRTYYLHPSCILCGLDIYQGMGNGGTG
ncbi:hypothetical protein [Neisseria arctica]|uniref:hypothetical protein n=1 Tax=Neisseria arctica TaxID=1470200 RepID=UPI00137912FC|nr:hypothetical protein [Neisseria arctica]UOO86268.1 hypothetical protein LVJ86_08590 [Neisseria arctica]